MKTDQNNLNFAKFFGDMNSALCYSCTFLLPYHTCSRLLMMEKGRQL